MIGLDRSSIRQNYRTGSDNLIHDFYLPCLGAASKYDRAVGYFRSSIFSIIGRDIIQFIKNEGVIRIICSTELDINDIKHIGIGLEERERIVIKSLDAVIDGMLSSKDLNDHARLLATLIAIQRLIIRFAFRHDNQGIYHEKIGIFSDQFGNSISFIGSANETLSGWSTTGNYESIEVFTNWNTIEEANRVERHRQHFDRLWANKEKGVTVVNFSEASVNKLLRIASSSIEAYEREMLAKGAVVSEIKIPMKHQSDAISNWKKVGCKGIFEHATGSGKTITAIIAIREHIEQGYPSIVFVPSELLLEQWEKELKSEIHDLTILKCGAGNSRWKIPGKLKSMSTGTFIGQKRVILSTMQTAATTLFQSYLLGTQELLVVADEVHQIGSIHLSNCMKIKSGKRLGLSATPSRYGDTEGTQRILDYFGPVVEPKFTLQDAIDSHRLVQYQYFPQLVVLTQSEEDEWNELSNRIRLEYFKIQKKETGNSDAMEIIKNLLIRRARLAKKASKKIPLSVQIIKENMENGDSWLVYCEDTGQLRQISDELGKNKIKSIEYHSEIDDGTKKATLDWFKRFGGVLLSIRCLDEGVDIPQINKALIIASSQNPRQFIQRRGRVLRNFKGKGIAYIYDMLVVPNSIESNSNQFSLLKSELLRAIEFSEHAINKTCAIELRSLADKFGILEDESEMEEHDG
jgi:superfamily II DNA or RNA helicase